ncbi:calmodulin-regulated spectrin-associated protein 2 isoform X3 [Gouania willdenowi]|uniref:calmodulin-regulated spectrin-associated protein 2 isoform X3 n=1 Tax=Gouania willdenowi TaxID=441366 RepID=UPI001056B2C2|nr:calmodulin-regulated spectrin-associated protein 2-like isoform X3 [Gouania willdenowi]
MMMGDRGVRQTYIVPAITSIDHYDFIRAKVCCSITWLVAKAFGSDAVPEELLDPFYRDQYNQEHLKPPVAVLLQSAELYCRAGSLILRSDAVKPLVGHNAVIQALAQKGLYVTDQDRLVTERDLTCTPIHMSSHLALMDTLMMAYTVEMVSVERVTCCISRFSHGDGHAHQMPYDTEDAVTTWINKVNEHLRNILVEEQKLRDAAVQETNTAAHKARYRRDLGQRNAPSLPLVDNLLKDNTDGCALTALLHFYCPQAVRLEDVCLKETMSLADCLYNLQLVQEFCRKNLNHCCHFSLEDMLYAHASIKTNYLVLMAELFWWFEVVKPSFVQPRVFNPNASSEPVVVSPFKQSRADTESAQTEGIMKRSSSVSHADICVGAWPKEKSSSARGVSFEIPLDGGPSSLPCEAPPLRSMTRSVSSDDGLSLRERFRRGGDVKLFHVSPLTPLTHVNGQQEDYNSHKPLGRNNTFSVKNHSRYVNGVLPDSSISPSHNHSTPVSPSTPPSIEEALKIIHSSERSHASLGVGHESFFLHGASTDPPLPHGAEPPLPHAAEPPLPRGAKEAPNDPELNSLSTDELDTGIHVRTEDIQSLDEDSSSSLRDYPDIDPDCESAATRSCPLPGGGGVRTLTHTKPGGGASVPTLNSPGSRTGESGGGLVRMTNFAEQKFRKLVGRSSGGTTENSDASVNRTPPTQSAAPPQPITSAPPSTPKPRDPSHVIASEMIQLRMKLEEKRRAIEAQKKKVEAAFTRHRQKMGRTAFLNVVRRKGVTSVAPTSQENKGSMERAERCKPDGAAPKSPCEDTSGYPCAEADLAEYTRSIERLNTSLGFLQTEMQRLAQQQERIMTMREQQNTHTWVVPSPHRQLRELRSSSVSGRGCGRGSVGSLSPVLTSSSSSAHVSASRSPAGIKRRPASFHARTPRTPRPNDVKVAPFSRMLDTPTSVDSLPRLRRFSTNQSQSSAFAYMSHQSECQDSNDQQKHSENATTTTSAQPWGPNEEAEKETEDGKHPVRADWEENKEQLEVEVELCDLKPPEEGDADLMENKMCCGFFYKDDVKAEEDMAARKAALLEKRLRREKEAQERKQQQEVEQEQKKEAARLKAEEEQQKKEEERARREYIRQEYVRKKQLKLMEDMERVVKPRCNSLKKKNKPRPKSIHRDVVEPTPPPPPTRAPGVRPRGFSVSSISLASLNMADNDREQCDNRKNNRGNKVPFYLSSPKERKERPGSTEGFSSCPSAGSGNGEKDWDNESSTSSNTDYTGPKLYKEPSAKSNKHIIQNALTHCCLAGKVNEGQKNKILNEMEKSEANNFLILFRDAGCQFRSVYTYCPESEEMVRLVGIGPKNITARMIDTLYKYNSDRKQFSRIPAKTMSASVDAITIHSHLWTSKKQATPPNKNNK